MAGKRLRSKCGRIKSLTRLQNRSFFVETLWSIATFRVSEEKFQISFWQQRFFFLFGRSKKKEMNKTDLCTKIFRFAQHDTSPPLVTLSTAKGLKPLCTKIFRFAQHDTSPPLVTLSTAKGLKPFYTKIFRLRL